MTNQNEQAEKDGELLAIWRVPAEDGNWYKISPEDLNDLLEAQSRQSRREERQVCAEFIDHLKDCLPETPPRTIIKAAQELILSE